MKFEPAEIIAAAHVRDLASALREGEWAAYARANNIPPALPSDGRTTWCALHPLSEFVPKAYDQLSGVAIQIRDLSKQ